MEQNPSVNEVGYETRGEGQVLSASRIRRLRERGVTKAKVMARFGSMSLRERLKRARIALSHNLTNAPD